MEITRSSHFSFSLKPRFSDQSHLVFYGCSPSVHFRPVKTRLSATASYSTTSPFTALPRTNSPLSQPSLRTSTCNAVASSVTSFPSETDLLQELTTLKAQVKLKKKQLKAIAKQQKSILKERKSKAKCESSSSSSESCDEGNMAINMRLWKKSLPSIRKEESLMHGVFEADELQGSHTNVDQSCVRQNQEENISCTTAEVSLNGFSFTSCRQKQLSINSLAHHVQDNTENAVRDASMSAPAHGYRLARSSTGNVEVCVGGKCKKAGSQQLLSSLKSQIPASLSVEAMPCKCMGRCTSAINVRVLKEDMNPQHHSHVGVDDAGFILSQHFGIGPPPSGLPRLPSFASPFPQSYTAKV